MAHRCPHSAADQTGPGALRRRLECHEPESSTLAAGLVVRPPRHRHQEFLVFCRQVARAYPGVDLHLVMDNYAAHMHPAVKEWLAANPRIHVH